MSSDERDPVIVSACRTPIGRFMGGLADVPATVLGRLVVADVVRRAGVPPTTVEEVILGNVLGADLGQAPARQAALGAGLSPSVAALTLNKVCGSGLKAVMLAAQAIRLGEADVVIAGGMESMSGAPYILRGARRGWKFGDRSAVDSMLHDGLVCAFENCHMGRHAESLAAARSISRRDQDDYALQSQHRAAEAVADGRFDDETVAVPIGSKGERLDRDEGPRAGTTRETLARLRPAFQDDGTVTAGNASMLSDGAAAVAVASRRFAKAHGLPILARIAAWATSGVEPRDLFIAPVSAVRTVVQRAGLTLADIDLFEINEAFAVQMVACMRELDVPADRVNVHGGAIALGHPIGASGARVLVTLLHTMKHHGAHRGLATLCLGGGNAVTVIIERSA